MEKRFVDASKQLRKLSEQSHEEKTLHLKLASQIKEIDILSSEKEALVQELKTSSEKCVKLEEQLGSSTPKSTEMSARKRVAILEIAELNERQKAEHLKRENEKLRITAKAASMLPVMMLPSSLHLALSGVLRAHQSIHQSIASVARLAATE